MRRLLNASRMARLWWDDRIRRTNATPALHVDLLSEIDERNRVRG